MWIDPLQLPGLTRKAIGAGPSTTVPARASDARDERAAQRPAAGAETGADSASPAAPPAAPPVAPRAAAAAAGAYERVDRAKQDRRWWWEDEPATEGGSARVESAEWHQQLGRAAWHVLHQASQRPLCCRRSSMSFLPPAAHLCMAPLAHACMCRRPRRLATHRLPPTSRALHTSSTLSCRRTRVRRLVRSCAVCVTSTRSLRVCAPLLTHIRARRQQPTEA